MSGHLAIGWSFAVSEGEDRATLAPLSFAAGALRRGLLAAAQAVNLAAIPLRRPAGAAISNDVRRSLDFRRGRRSEILEEHGGFCRAAAPGRERCHPVDLLEAVQAHAHDVAHADRLGGLRGGVVDAHVAGLHCRRGLAARLREAHRPDPRINSNRHAPSILRGRLRRGRSRAPSLLEIPITRIGWCVETEMLRLHG